MDLLSLRAASGGGSIDGHAASGLVAAGFTLLQRSPTLVRALAGRRAAILLPASSRYLVALAAGDGRGVVLLDPQADPAGIALQLVDAGVGAVFTIARLDGLLPAGIPRALLDEAPTAATVIASDGTRARVDLGSHFGLDVEGDATAAGRDEECLLVFDVTADNARRARVLTHRDLITNSRWTAQELGFTPGDHLLAIVPFDDPLAFTVAAIGPLLGGARVSTMTDFDADAAIELLASDQITALAATPPVLAALVGSIERRPRPVAPRLRLVVTVGTGFDGEAEARWTVATGITPCHAVARADGSVEFVRPSR